MGCHAAFFSSCHQPPIVVQNYYAHAQHSVFNVQSSPSSLALSFWCPVSFFGVPPRIFQPKGQIECNHCDLRPKSLWYVRARISSPYTDAAKNPPQTALLATDAMNGYKSSCWQTDASTNRTSDTLGGDAANNNTAPGDAGGKRGQMWSPKGIGGSWCGVLDC